MPANLRPIAWLILYLGIIVLMANVPAQALTLDLSADLVAKGIASRNMRPNARVRNATPLLNAAIAYASDPSHQVTRIVARRGRYYFKSVVGIAHVAVTSSQFTHILVEKLHGVTINLRGSELIFAQEAVRAIQVANCQACTLKNFSIDYSTLPFTQLAITNVERERARVAFVPMVATEGQPPFNTPRRLEELYSSTEPPTNVPDLYAFGFRDGKPLYTPRWTVTVSPTDDHSVILGGGYLDSIRPGDVLEVEARGGSPAIWVVQGNSQILLEGISIYSAANQGIISTFAPNLVMRNLALRPPPGSNRLVSTNGGGIAMAQIAGNNRIESCDLIGNQDDAISGFCQTVGVLAKSVKAGDQQLELSGYTSDYFTTPTPTVFLVNPLTGLPYPAVGILPQPAGGSNSTTAIIELAAPLPFSMVNGAQMFDADPANRGFGLRITNNRIISDILARGINLGGMSGVTIRDNLIRLTPNAGIAINYDLKGSRFMNAPSDDIQIFNNDLESTNIGEGPVGFLMLGAIQFRSLNSHGDTMTTQPNTEIQVINNRISHSARTGIWAENIQGRIAGNELEDVCFDPSVPANSPVGGSLTLGQAREDFKKPILIRASVVKTN